MPFPITGAEAVLWSWEMWRLARRLN